MIIKKLSGRMLIFCAFFLAYSSGCTKNWPDRRESRKTKGHFYFDSEIEYDVNGVFGRIYLDERKANVVLLLYTEQHSISEEEFKAVSQTLLQKIHYELSGAKHCYIDLYEGLPDSVEAKYDDWLSSVYGSHNQAW